MILLRDPEGDTRQLCFSAMHPESFQACSSCFFNDSNFERKSILLAKASTKDPSEYVLKRDQWLIYSKISVLYLLQMGEQILDLFNTGHVDTTAARMW